MEEPWSDNKEEGGKVAKEKPTWLGTLWKLKVKDASDLERGIFKSASATISIPELDFEVNNHLCKSY
jgi:C4-type Zn-finger protein